MSAPEKFADYYRAGVLESTHRGWIAVVDSSGRLVASQGDPERISLARSAMKPFQAVALVESGAVDRYGFGDAELAIACASHHGEPRHVETVQGMLNKLGLPVSALRAGDDHWHAEPPSSWEPHDQLTQNCSGKHAGMLAACQAQGYSIDDYDDLAHPHQRTIRSIVAQFWDVAEDELIAGRDDCTLPAYAAPLRNIALGWARIADPAAAPGEHQEAVTRVGNAMAAAPWMVTGAHGTPSQLMDATDGRILAKDGAEGMLCLALREHGLGVALKTEDGSYRVHGLVVREILRQLEAVSQADATRLAELWPTERFTNRHHHAGDIVPRVALTIH